MPVAQAGSIGPCVYGGLLSCKQPDGFIEDLLRPLETPFSSSFSGELLVGSATHKMDFQELSVVGLRRSFSDASRVEPKVNAAAVLLARIAALTW